jgi:glucose-6-phosphate isomerase
VAASLIPHRTMPGDRPSNVLLLPQLSAYEVGQLLSLYEHRTVVEGFVWGIDSFDQWGVELGKKLADKVRKQMVSTRKKGEEVKGFNPSTEVLLSRFMGKQSKL